MLIYHRPLRCVIVLATHYIIAPSGSFISDLTVVTE
jgi:hypothetical protein